MNTITFKQRLKSAKASLRKKEAAGEVTMITRPWSSESLQGFRKALRGGSVHVVRGAYGSEQAINSSGK